MIVDLNCDMGEGVGSNAVDNDRAIMDYISSVNIACGFHAGNPAMMRQTVDSAVTKNISVGAHPGFPDLDGFGRNDIDMEPEEIYNIVLYQVGALKAFTKSAGVILSHVKPHGALYNMAAKDPAIANAIARAIATVDTKLVVFGLSGSHLIHKAKSLGLKTANEVFADRTYQDDGSLTSRKSDQALIKDPLIAASQALQMVFRKKVTSLNGNEISVQADTICIHGDNIHALEFAKIIHQTLKENHVTIQHP